MRPAHFLEDWSAAKQPHLWRLCGYQRIDAAQYAFADHFRFWHWRLDVGFVLDGDVVEDALVFVVHPSNAFLHDHSDLVGIGRVVSDQVGDCGGEDMAVSVLMLESFTIEGRAPSCGADEEASGAGIAGGVCKVTEALQTEHGVEDEERDHRNVERGVGHAASDE